MTLRRTAATGWRRRLAAALAALGVAVLLVAAPSTGTTEASWRDSELARGTFTAGVLTAPVANGCGHTSSAFTPHWTAAVAPSVPPASYQYRLFWKPDFAPGWYVGGWTNVGAATQFTYAPPGSISTAGHYTFEVQAIRGSWTSPSRSGTAHVTSLFGFVSVDTCAWS